jgi:hypothetical protein
MKLEARGLHGRSKHGAYEEQEYMVVNTASVEQCEDGGRSCRWLEHGRVNDLGVSRLGGRLDTRRHEDLVVWSSKPLERVWWFRPQNHRHGFIGLSLKTGGAFAAVGGQIGWHAAASWSLLQGEGESKRQRGHSINISRLGQKRSCVGVYVRNILGTVSSFGHLLWL